MSEEKEMSEAMASKTEDLMEQGASLRGGLPVTIDIETAPSSNQRQIDFIVSKARGFVSPAAEKASKEADLKEYIDKKDTERSKKVVFLRAKVTDAVQEKTKEKRQVEMDDKLAEFDAEVLTRVDSMTSAMEYAEEKANESNAELRMSILNKTALVPHQGEIGCIVIHNMVKNKTIQLSRPQSEATMLEELFSFHRQNNPVYHGHNIAGFDLKFIATRAMILGVRIPDDFPVNVRFNNSQVCDQMLQVGGRDTFGKPVYPSVQEMQYILGMESHKEQLDSSEVPMLYLSGDWQTPLAHCVKDVEAETVIARHLNPTLPQKM